MSVTPSSSIWSGPTGPSLGGHAQCSPGFDADSLWAWSSWIAPSARPNTGSPLFLKSSEIALPVPADGADWTQVVTYYEDQQTSDCVGCAFEGAHQIATKGLSKRTSPLSWYRGARLRARLRAGEALTDSGCQPIDGANAAISVGISPRDANDDNPSTVNEYETWGEATGSKLFDPSCFALLDDGNTDQIRAHLTAGHGLLFCMQVDDSYETFASTNPIARISWSFVAANVSSSIAVLGGPVYQ